MVSLGPEYMMIRILFIWCIKIEWFLFSHFGQMVAFFKKNLKTFGLMYHNSA